MRVLCRLLIIMGLLLAACGSLASTRPVSDHGGGIVPEISIVMTDPETAPDGSESRMARNDFRPTDPTTVVLASGRPQLVEFYADW